jgi:hypothetical protein
MVGFETIGRPKQQAGEVQMKAVKFVSVLGNCILLCWGLQSSVAAESIRHSVERKAIHARKARELNAAVAPAVSLPAYPPAGVPAFDEALSPPAGH